MRESERSCFILLHPNVQVEELGLCRKRGFIWLEMALMRNRDEINGFPALARYQYARGAPLIQVGSNCLDRRKK